jgi:hypothetical protein
MIILNNFTKFYLYRNPIKKSKINIYSKKIFMDNNFLNNNDIVDNNKNIDIDNNKNINDNIDIDNIDIDNNKDDSIDDNIDNINILKDNKRTKKNAKKNEEIDIRHLISIINNSESLKGKEIKDAFKSKFNKEIKEARIRNGSGNRKTHYDFQINIDDKWFNVEHKGSKQYISIDNNKPPWFNGVQFYNGGMEKYRLALKYSQLWYNEYIKSGFLKEKYKLVEDIPLFEEWLKDVKVQGKPKTKFGIELKKTYQSIPGNEKKSLLKERDDFVEKFIKECNENDLILLKEDILPLLKNTLNEKDYWLQVSGDILNEKFYFNWYEKLIVNEINEINIYKKKDIEITFKCDNNFSFKGILRWGYGAGFSNLRLDLK